MTEKTKTLLWSGCLLMVGCLLACAIHGCAATDSGKGLDWFSRAFSPQKSPVTVDHSGDEYNLGTAVKDHAADAILFGLLVLAVVRLMTLRKELDKEKEDRRQEVYDARRDLCQVKETLAYERGRGAR